MLNGKTIFERILFYLFAILICRFSTINADEWSYGQDIPNPSFNWNMVPSESIEPFYFIDFSDHKIKVWHPRKYSVNDNSDNFITSHCSTSGGTKLLHDHFQNNFNENSENNIPAYYEVDAFWDIYFSSPSICSSSFHATNQSNCMTCAAYYCLDGNYNYWMGPTQFSIALTEEAEDNPSTPYQNADIINYYPYQKHVSVIGNVVAGEIESIFWKYNASRVYIIYDTASGVGTHLDDLDTPSNTFGCAGNAEDGIYGFFPDGWVWDKAGDGSTATVWRPD